MIAVQVHDQAVLLGVDLQLAQDRQRLVRLFQRQVGAYLIAAIELGEVIEPALQHGRGEQPLLDGGLVLGRIPVTEHHRMGVGQPVDVVVVVGQHALHPADVVGADGLLATRVGDAGEQRIALQEPAIADILENLDALQSALLSGVQVVPFQQDLATHPVDELHDRRRLQLGLLDVLDGALLQRIGLLQIALGDGDFRQLAQVPHHQVRRTNLPGAALGLLVLFLRLGQQPLDEVRLGQPRQRRHPGGAHDQRLTRQRFIGQGDGLLLVAAVHRHLRTYRVELADDARPVLLRTAFLQSLFAGLEPALYLVELVGVLRHPSLQQGEQRRAGDDRLRQGFQALLQQTQATLAIELLAVALQHLANLHRTAGLYGVAGGLFRHVFRQQRFGGPQMQVGQPVRLVATQLALQKEREQRMVGIPLAQAVQRLHEQSDAFELFEHAASVAALGQAIGQRRVEALQQAGRLQEVEGRRTERFHHLLAHVVADTGMAELQVFQKQVHAAPGLHFLHRQLQRARPAADAPVEALDLLAVDGHRQRKVEQCLHLFRLEGQVRRVHRQQLMLDPQVRHAQFRQAAAAH